MNTDHWLRLSSKTIHFKELSVNFQVSMNNSSYGFSIKQGPIYFVYQFMVLPLIFHQFTSCASVIIFYINLIRYCVAYICFVKTKINCLEEDLQDPKKLKMQHFELTVKEIAIAHQKSLKY